MQPYKDNNRKEIHAEGRGFANGRYDEQRRRASPPRREADQGRWEMRGNYHENRGYKGKWVPHRYRRSPMPHYRAAQAGNDVESEMCGLIFMCNKRTSRKCLEYNVLGMPTGRRSLANKVAPGMKLFLFEFESRELHGVFEATGYAEDNLEPRAFEDAEIKFPIHVPFRVAEKCAPLRECQFKEAISGNYFEANRFRFNLSKVQVVKLLDLFLPKEAPYERRSLFASHRPDSSPYADPRRPNYDEREGRVYIRDEWKDEEEFRKPVDSMVTQYQLDYSTNRHYLQYREPASTVTYEPDYKLGKYPGLSTVTGDYGYNSVVDVFPSASAGVQHVGSSAGPYAAIPSKYETLMTGYTVGRTELTGLPEADRYWKAGVAAVQVTGEPYAVKQGVYARPPAFEGGVAGGNGQRPLETVEDVTLKKPLVSDVEYLQLPPVPLGHPLSAVKEPEYSTVPAYTSEFRRAPAAYPEDSVDMLSNQAARYATSNGVSVREEPAYQVRAVGIPAIGTSVSDRYLPPRELSPSRPPVPESRYNGGPYRAGSYYNAERAGRYDVRGSTMNDYELQPVPKDDYGVSGKYYADRGAYHRKLSVWERVSGFPGPRNRYHNQDYDFDRGYKRTRGMSLESQGDDFNHTAGEDDGSFAFDFKRRNSKNIDSGGPSHPFTSTFPRKRRFVRPGQQYVDRPQTTGN